MAILAEDLASISTMFPPIQAQRVYVVNNFTNAVAAENFARPEPRNRPFA